MTEGKLHFPQAHEPPYADSTHRPRPCASQVMPDLLSSRSYRSLAVRTP
jgi:hypothetical protein